MGNEEVTVEFPRKVGFKGILNTAFNRAKLFFSSRKKFLKSVFLGGVLGVVFLFIPLMFPVAVRATDGLPLNNLPGKSVPLNVDLSEKANGLNFFEIITKKRFSLLNSLLPMSIGFLLITGLILTNLDLKQGIESQVEIIEILRTYMRAPGDGGAPL